MESKWPTVTDFSEINGPKSFGFPGHDLSQFWSSDVSHMLILTSNKQGVWKLSPTEFEPNWLKTFFCIIHSLKCNLSNISFAKLQMISFLKIFNVKIDGLLNFHDVVYFFWKKAVFSEELRFYTHLICISQSHSLQMTTF